MKQKENEVVILCGGMGSRLSEETIKKPKPMVEIGGEPILIHIMRHYSNFGYYKFILALGYKSDYIKKYFYDYRITSSDFTTSLSPNSKIIFHDNLPAKNWQISCIDTGLKTLKGGRIKRLEKYIKSEDFLLTYGDGVSDVNISLLMDFHLKHKSIGTVTCVRPPSRFGEMTIEGDSVKVFYEKAQMNNGNINGGYFVLNKKIMKYLTPDEDCDFEFGPLQKIANDGELKAYFHNGFWQCMDNIRERDFLNKLIEEQRAPWINF